MDARIVDKAGLIEKTGLDSETIDSLVREKKIPFIEGDPITFDYVNVLHSMYDVDEMLDFAGVPRCIPVGPNPLFIDGVYQERK